MRELSEAERSEIVESVRNFMDCMSMDGLHGGTVLDEPMLSRLRGSLVSFLEARAAVGKATAG